MTHSRRKARGARPAFTLIEMLTVVGIIAALMALAGPALVDVIRATRLNSAGDGLVNRMSLAQQSAISLGREVEMRFYKYANDDVDPSGKPVYSAYQVVDMPVVGDEPMPRALSDVYYIESGVILSAQKELSPLLKTTTQQRAAATGQFLFRPTVGQIEPQSVAYAALRFYPDGSCKVLAADEPGEDVQEAATAYTIPTLTESFLTLVEGRDVDQTQPKNFYCIQIDSYTGKTRVYRP